MDSQTKAKIDSLLYELRTWDDAEDPPCSLQDLARRFQLDPLVVQRIAQSEGWDLDEAGVPEAVSDTDTEPIDLDEK